MTRIPLLLGLSLLLAGLAAAYPPPEWPCVDTSTGYRACGTVTADPMVGASAAQGEATGAVTWQHCITTLYPYTHVCDTEGPQVTYAGTVTSRTASCARGSLYADGALVAQNDWSCW